LRSRWASSLRLNSLMSSSAVITSKCPILTEKIQFICDRDFNVPVSVEFSFICCFPAGEGFLHGGEGEVGFGYFHGVEPVAAGDFGWVELGLGVVAACGEKEIEDGVGDVFIGVLVWVTGQVLDVGDDESHFFFDFPFQGFLCDFSGIDESADDRQFAFGRLFGAFDEEHVAFLVEDQARRRDGWVEKVGVFAGLTDKGDLILGCLRVSALRALPECEIWFHARTNLL